MYYDEWVDDINERIDDEDIDTQWALIQIGIEQEARDRMELES